MSDFLLDPEVLARFLPQQRWFGAKDRRIEKAHVTEAKTLRDESPKLEHALVEVQLEGGAHPTYQLLIGLRPLGESTEFLHGSEHAVFGEVGTEAGPAVAYDATLDGELMLHLLRVVAPDEEVRLVRLMAAEQSNTSLVYDDRLILKLFRQLGDGPNPDVEVTTRLAEIGFTHVAEPVASWRQDGRDLAFLQRYLAGGTEGWSLALTSLRDLFGEHDTQQLPIINPNDPPPSMNAASAGGDFAAEAGRLGQVTAELHAAMAEAFGRSTADAGAWLTPMEAQLTRTSHAELDRDRVRRLLERLRSIDDLGPAVRIHGDYHLGQVMRTDTGWYVLDFEGEPARPLAERQLPSSPLRDVAGMLRSFHYAAQVGLRDRDPGGEQHELAEMAADWEARNRDAFLDGYLPVAEKEQLLPSGADGWQPVLAAFELDKAVYELAYEMAHRPDWVRIPVAAIARILESES